MTREEKAREHSEISIYSSDFPHDKRSEYNGFLEGAKWQAEQDVEKAINAIKETFCHLINGEWDCECNECEKDCRQMKEFIEKMK